MVRGIIGKDLWGAIFIIYYLNPKKPPNRRFFFNNLVVQFIVLSFVKLNVTSNKRKVILKLL